MDATNNTKIKLLKLLELLRSQTDEAHPMCTKDILAHLMDMGITCDRRTISRDIKVLCNNGYEVMSTMQGHDKAYYIEDRGFSIPEIRLLIDAVLAASFLTEKKTDQLLKKISQLGGMHQGDLLLNNSIYLNRRKHRNESIFYSIDQIQRALEEKKTISCYYFDLNENHEKIYRKEKKRYILEPYALVIRDDNYYLLTYTPKYQDTTTYRVDRMEDVRVEKEEVCAQTMQRLDHVSEHLQEAFHMYSGVSQWVVMRFDPALIGAIYDTFGEDTQMERQSDGSLTAKVLVQVSPTFWGWIFQFEGKMEIIHPQTLVYELHRRLSPFLPPDIREELARADEEQRLSLQMPRSEEQGEEQPEELGEETLAEETAEE